MEEKTAKQNKRNKKQLIAAITVTALLAVSTFTYAWFAWQASIKSVVKVKNPSKIQIMAGNTEDAERINIGNIDLRDLIAENPIPNYETVDGEEVLKGYSKQYVFSVCSENDGYALAKNYSYYIQLGATTNVDFKYRIYKATEEETVSEDVKTLIDNGTLTEYESVDGTLFYYRKGASSVKNSDGELISLDVDDSETYGDYENVQEHAYPKYYRTDAQTPSKTLTDGEWKFVDYYILEVYWDAEISVPPDKETDSVYLVVYDNQS